MSAQQSNSPDTAALLAALGQGLDLCRRLNLPKEAATYESLIARFKREPPTYEVLRSEEVLGLASGLSALRILAKLGSDHSEFNRLQNALRTVIFPEDYHPAEQTESQNRKAVRESETFWQLEGESDLYAITLPDPPQAHIETTIRLTLSNSYGPIDGAELFVRIGDPDRPTAQDDLHSATDWVEAHLVEELVTVDDEEMLRSEAQEPFEDETPWEGTYEAPLLITAGRRSIEVKLLSQHPELLSSLVLTGWVIAAM